MCQHYFGKLGKWNLRGLLTRQTGVLKGVYVKGDSENIRTWSESSLAMIKIIQSASYLQN